MVAATISCYHICKPYLCVNYISISPCYQKPIRWTKILSKIQKYFLAFPITKTCFLEGSNSFPILLLQNILALHTMIRKHRYLQSIFSILSYIFPCKSYITIHNAPLAYVGLIQQWMSFCWHDEYYYHIIEGLLSFLNTLLSLIYPFFKKWMGSNSDQCNTDINSLLTPAV